MVSPSPDGFYAIDPLQDLGRRLCDLLVTTEISPYLSDLPVEELAFRLATPLYEEGWRRIGPR